MSMVIRSFNNLHDNRVLRYCADFEAHSLHMDTAVIRKTGPMNAWARME